VYQLVSKDNVRRLLKYGITSAADPRCRYCESYYDQINGDMEIIGIYNWRLPARLEEFNLCMAYTLSNGHLPPLSKTC
jgi:hypothetical protein